MIFRDNFEKALGILLVVCYALIAYILYISYLC
jgi:hypothetical protein